jgi:hypothetical protein
VSEDDRVKQACAYLRMLLVRPGDYRNRWAGYGSVAELDVIDEQAVAAVLHERRAGNRERDGQPVLTRPTDALVTVCRQALAGTALRPTDMEQFILAFGFSARHAHRLRELRRGSPSVLAITDALLPPGEVYRHASPPHYDSLALHELHTIGPDGRPAEHETIQVIKATVPWLESVPYRFDTDELMVQVVRGGRVGDQVYRVNEIIYGVDIALTHPLAMGETTLLQLHTTFAYKQPPPPLFRRGVMRSTEDLTMWVRFHPQRLPARVWSARWDRIDQAHVIDQQPAELDSELSVHARFGRVEQAIVGFYWEWS